MKYLFFHFLLLGAALSGLIWQPKIDPNSPKIGLDFYRNPVAKVSEFLGKRVTVFSNIREVKVYDGMRMIVMGRWGKPQFPQKFSSDLIILIRSKDVSKFKNIKDAELLNSFATITGKVIRYHKKIAVQLSNINDLKYDSYKNPVFVR